MAKIVELNRHEPNVDSVCERLSRHRNRIKSIIAVIEWDNGSYDVTHDTKSVESICFEAALLQKYAQSFIGYEACPLLVDDDGQD